MTTSKIFRHENYELLCGAQAVGGGKFAPTLVITKQVWPTRPRVVAVGRGDYADAEGAIDAAHGQGIEWIARAGQCQVPALSPRPLHAHRRRWPS